MLKCDEYAVLIMRYFDGDLGRKERENLDRHLDSCSHCRALFAQLAGILGTLENAEAAEPQPHLERLVMDRIMLLPTWENNNEKRMVKLIYGSFAGMVVLLFWVITLVVQDSGFLDLVLTGSTYLDVLSGLIIDAQIVYRIAASFFSSEIFSLLLSMQLIFILAVFLLAIVALRAFGGQRGAHSNVS